MRQSPGRTENGVGETREGKDMSPEYTYTYHTHPSKSQKFSKTPGPVQHWSQLSKLEYLQQRANFKERNELRITCSLRGVLAGTSQLWKH